MDTHMCGYEKSAHLYDLFGRKDDLPFFLRCAGQAEEILDVGAGTGRIAIPLAAQGARVICVEPSPAMRRQFRAKLERRPHLRRRIELLPDDAASFDLGRTLSTAILAGTFDHFAGKDERLASLRNIVRHLEPGGTLVFDVFLGLMEPSPPSPAGRCQIGDREYRRFVGRQTLPDQRIRVDLAFEIHHSSGRMERIEEVSVVGVTQRDEVHEVLAQTGCSVRHEFSDYDFSPYREGDDLLIVEAIHRPGSGAAGGA